MLLFRSEEDVDAWCEARHMAPGATMAPEQCWQLARAWYGDRLHPDWERKSVDEAHAIFEGIGLTGAFWRLK